MTNLTVFADLLKDVPTECKNAVLPEPLLKYCTINCLTFEENITQPYNDNLCLFRALFLHMQGNQRLEDETSRTFNSFMNTMDGIIPNQVEGVPMNNIPIVDVLLTLIFLLYDADIIDRSIIKEPARGSVQKYEKTVKLLRYNNQICYVSSIDAAFQTFRCPNCDIFLKRTFNLERNLSKCSERVKNVYPTNVYQTQVNLLTNWTLLTLNTLMSKHFSKYSSV